MRIILAEKAGFCFGVERAVNAAYEFAEKGEKCKTFGPLIHNADVVRDLEQRGIGVLESADEAKKDETVLIRAHGVSPDIYDKLKTNASGVFDSTCPFVKKIHHIAELAGREGKTLVIAGDPEHPEVKGIVGWADGRTEVIQEKAEAAALPLAPDEKFLLAAQTTFNAGKFEDIVEIFRKRGYDDFVMNTVCSATDERQTEAREIARMVDAMIVIGGRHSSNTRKLVEICKETCGNTYFIETLDDLDLKPFQSFSCVGITAGASTPNSIIEEVTKHVRTKL